MSTHAWEEPEDGQQPAASSAHSWEEVDCATDHASDGDNDDADNVYSDSGLDADTGTASDEFIGYCTDLLLRRDLNAKQFCTIMQLAADAGISACRPLGAMTGHYHRKVSAHLGRLEDRAELYMLETPGFSKQHSARDTRDLPVFLPHEQLSLHMDDRTSFLVREAIHDDRLPPCYYDHPVVRAAPPGEVVVPIALYVDAVPYTLTDSVIGVWVEEWVTGRRHLVAALRKKRCCRCGRRGWCSLFPLFRMLAYSFRALATKQYPTSRHDGSA